MKQYHKYVGLDVHKERNEVAIADSSGEVRLYGSISNDLHPLEKLVVKLRGPASGGIILYFVYEAGPCGFVIQRRLQQLGEECLVVAPSLIPRKSGDRVKTDRRDATMLARLHRAGELTGIHVPDPRDEAIRDLVRARTDTVTDRRDNRHRLQAFLLRHGYKYAGKSAWTPAHLRYLRELVLADPAHKVVLEEYLRAITQATERIERLETHLATLAATWRMKPVADALQGLRGVQLLTAVALAAELGDLSRFRHPRQLMAFLGLVPSEYTSGDTRRQGSITMAGNNHALWSWSKLRSITGCRRR
jgi:transposase